jgi:hypothetical protein
MLVERFSFFVSKLDRVLFKSVYEYLSNVTTSTAETHKSVWEDGKKSNHKPLSIYIKM